MPYIKKYKNYQNKTLIIKTIQYFCITNINSTAAASKPAPTITYSPPAYPTSPIKKPINTGESEEIPVDIPFIIPAAVGTDSAGTNFCKRVQETGVAIEVEPNAHAKRSAEA